MRAHSQAQVLVSPNAGVAYLLNASPRLRSQILSEPSLAPAIPSRHTPFRWVWLTSADASRSCAVDCIHAPMSKTSWPAKNG